MSAVIIMLTFSGSWCLAALIWTAAEPPGACGCCLPHDCLLAQLTALLLPSLCLHLQPALHRHQAKRRNDTYRMT